MKKAFDMPKIVVEQFVPNEYVAACGDQNLVYKFKCDATAYTGIVYQDSNMNGQLDWAEITNPLAVTYHACGEEHEAPVKDDFVNGWLVATGDGSLVTPVIIWTAGGTNVHCTVQLDKDSWETSKS